MNSDTELGARKYLNEWSNAGGGWGYEGGRKSRLEPTCLTVLCDVASTGDSVDSETAALSRRQTLLEHWPSERGLLVDGPGLPPNIGFNGLALFTLAALGSPATPAAALANALQSILGVTAENSQDVGQDSSLRGWPWVKGTFSWAEPTAWCLLGLKHWRKRLTSTEAQARLDMRFDEAHRLLFDRACAGGGWNYGNRRIFGDDLEPFVPTTAVVLLALQDRPTHPTVKAGLDWLRRHQAGERSTLALSLAIIALRTHGIASDEAAKALTSTLPGTIRRRNVPATALAVLASHMVGEKGRGNIWRIPS